MPARAAPASGRDSRARFAAVRNGGSLVGPRTTATGPRGHARERGIAADSRQRGFTLLEMLVALAVFGLVVIALLNLSGESTRTAAIVEERVLAGVVAQNRAVEAAIEPLPAVAQAAAGRERLGDRDWEWTRAVYPTDDAAIVRVEVAVMAPGADRVAAQTTLFRSAR